MIYILVMIDANTLGVTVLRYICLIYIILVITMRSTSNSIQNGNLLQVEVAYRIKEYNIHIDISCIITT